MTARSLATRLTGFWRFVISTPEGISTQDARFLAVLRVGMPLAALFHAMFLVVFVLIGQSVLAWFNALSVGLFSVATWMAYRHGMRSITTVMICLLGEIPVHALLATLYLGFETLFVLYAVTGTVSVAFAHFFRPGTRLAIFLYLVACIVGCTVISFTVPPLSPTAPVVTMAIAVANAILATAVISLIVTVFAIAVNDAEARARSEYDRAETLLRNILPDEIADRLKAAPETIADEFPEATILFADIVGFTERSSRLPPAELVKRLNQVFSTFDELALRHGVEKIKTIGDAYMVVAGLPKPRPDHAAVIVELARDMLEALDRINEGPEEPIRLRIGINTGPVVAGVIGQTKFAYDLWGDAVNVAARLEELAEPDEVRISEATAQALGGGHAVIDKGLAEVKGKGQMRTYAVAD